LATPNSAPAAPAACSGVPPISFDSAETSSGLALAAARAESVENGCGFAVCAARSLVNDAKSAAKTRMKRR
jgi:hypothetical protein